MFLLFRSLQQQAPPGATLHCWRLQVLVGNSTAQPPGWRQAELEADVRRVLQPAVVVSHATESLRRPHNAASTSSHVLNASGSRLRCTCPTAAHSFQQHNAAPSPNTSLLNNRLLDSSIGPPSCRSGTRARTRRRWRRTGAWSGCRAPCWCRPSATWPPARCGSPTTLCMRHSAHATLHRCTATLHRHDIFCAMRQSRGPTVIASDL